ncbi:arylsulfatase [Stieleria varia]|nr:arylsulfatase [Stieleria varia]
MICFTRKRLLDLVRSIGFGFQLSMACLLVASVGITSASNACADGKSPNVLVILADDQGWGDLSLHGNPNLSTPNIDSLARDGAQIDHFYVCAVCSPTRAEFLTGRYHTRMGVYSTSAGGERFNVDERTIGDVFRGAGYATAAYGKWHSGMQWPYHPNARGFDDFYGFCSGHWGNYFSPMLEHNGQIVEGKGFIVDDLTSHAIDFISAHSNSADSEPEQGSEPFFVYLPLNTPHSPMQVPDPFWDRFADKAMVPDPAPENAKGQDIQHTRAAMAMCENIDHNVGRLLRHLDEQKLADNTIVVYFSDNGPNGKRFNGGMRGRKGSTTEGGLRSPCLIRYPAQIPAGTHVKQVGAAIDLLPTLADLAEIGWEQQRPLDGISLADALRQMSTGPTDRLLFSAWGGKATVRSQQYRMQRDGSLYDLAADPGETTDIAGQRPEIAGKMKSALDAWIAETKPLSRDHKETRPFPLGHPQATWTQLPARDAKSTGAIVRSNRFPNCTFMTKWTNTRDQITWDVDVLAEGDFEVQMYYSCPAESVGSTIRLTCGESTLDAEISEPNDAPLIGMKEDRLQRAEGYVRRWKPMTLGQIHLEPGRTTLALRATDVPGEQVADMRLLMFRRLP